jgi:hypothetical protein
MLPASSWPVVQAGTTKASQHRAPRKCRGRHKIAIQAKNAREIAIPIDARTDILAGV